jgi:hypothetical protein
LLRWGEGLEILTECYFKYVKKCLVQRGYVYQKKKRTKIHPITGIDMHTITGDVDLIAFKPVSKEVILIQTKEDILKNDVEKLLKSFDESKRIIKEELFERNPTKMSCWVTYVNGEEAAKKLNEAGIKTLSFPRMVKELVKVLPLQKKGPYREHFMWLLQTLKRKDLLQT